MGGIRIARSGWLTTVQDDGRWEYLHHGVPVSGAMDRWSLELANWLVGNPATHAILEMTMFGDEFQCEGSLLLSVTGADMHPRIRSNVGEWHPLPQGRPVWVAEGTHIDFRRAVSGCRTYVAFAGGVDVPIVLGSRSTYRFAKIGGLDGRALRTGDRLAVGGSSLPANSPNIGQEVPFTTTSWYCPTEHVPYVEQIVTLHVLPGADWSSLSQRDRDRFWATRFQILPTSDRMGYRLGGPKFTSSGSGEVLSQGTAAGTIQWPPDGNPILLMMDAAPTGGYAQLGHVISTELPIVAQLPPGQTIQFQPIELDEAHSRYRAIEQDRQRLSWAIEFHRMTLPKSSGCT